jgi:hypothetical protein
MARVSKAVHNVSRLDKTAKTSRVVTQAHRLGVIRFRHTHGGIGGRSFNVNVEDHVGGRRLVM